MCKNFYSIELASSGPCYLINNSMVGMDVPLLHSPGKGPAAESCSLSCSAQSSWLISAFGACILLCVLFVVYLFRGWGGFFWFKCYFSPLCCG